MKHKLIFLALVLSIFSISAVTQQPKPQQWEYKLVTGKAYEEKKLNALGSEGWELASCAAGLDACILKRPK